MSLRERLWDAVGGLSSPSKMPGYAYGIPAVRCKVGSILRKVAGSVCGSCYALKGLYRFPVVRDAQARRMAALEADMGSWGANMVRLLELVYARKKGRKARVFRWHDSGDLTGIEHLRTVVRVANELPTIRFWIPTKEYGVVREYLKRDGAFPPNLAVRISAPIVGELATPIEGALASTVEAGEGKPCFAWRRAGSCGDCRACWDTNVPSVDYRAH